MADDDEAKGLQFDFRRSQDRWKALVALVVYTLTVGGGAGVFSTQYRVDPFTGTEGRALKQRVSDIERKLNQLPPDWLKSDVVRHGFKIESLEKQMVEIHRHVETHEKDATPWKERIQSNSQAIVYLQHLIGVRKE